MAEELIRSVQEMLKEETWTRAAISNYSKEKIVELSTILENAKKENCIDELKKVCDEQLSHSKESIIALYLSGMISLMNEDLDNSELVALVDIFQKNHKEAVVEYLCSSILEDDPNNAFALRTLAEYYRSQDNDKVWELYAKIVKLDLTEADIAKVLGEHFESEGDLESAEEYYKIAILRYVTAQNIAGVKDMWSKLVQIIPQEIDFFQSVKRKASKTLGEDKTAILLQELYAWYRDNEKWDIAISLLKEILAVDQKDLWARKEITECYKGKHAGHSNLDEYIRSSNLTQSYRNVFEAINDFEKHIAFDVKSFVFHKSWGVGKIMKVENDTLTINFGRKYGVREMALKMAVNALTPLAKDHIWVIKATTKDVKALADKVKKDKVWALKTIIKSFDNNCDFKRIKNELVPSVLEPKEWTSWNSAAKRILDTNEHFGVNPTDINCYTVRENVINREEKLANEFKAQKQFFARIDTTMKFMYTKETDKTSELFNEMYNYFAGYVKVLASDEMPSKISKETLASYLVVKRITEETPTLPNPVKGIFHKIYARIEDPCEMYTELKDTKNTFLRHDYLESIKMLPTWADEYIKLFPTVLEMDLISFLLNNGNEEKVQKLVKTAFENYRDYRNAIIFLFKNCQEEEWYKKAEVPYEKQLIALIQLIEITSREINSSVNSTENKKIRKNATDLLFENDTLINYMFKNSEDTVKRMYTLIDDLNDLNPDYKARLRNKILEVYPTFKFQKVATEKSSSPKGMLVTAAKLEEKKALLEKIQKVDLPAIANEVAEAKAQGDLKENAEYKAAKEAQHKLNKDAEQLQRDLAKAIVFDPTTITTAVISFATVVTLHNNKTDKNETITVLGPWESDPENNVYSYMAPFGNAILDRKVGENIKFEINGNQNDYTVVEIKAAKI